MMLSIEMLISKSKLLYFIKNGIKQKRITRSLIGTVSSPSTIIPGLLMLTKKLSFLELFQVRIDMIKLVKHYCKTFLAIQILEIFLTRLTLQ